MACAWGRRSGDHDLADGYLADESRPIRLARAMSSRSHLSLRTHDEFVQGRPRKSRRSSTPEHECRPPGTSEADPLPLSTFPKQAVRPMLEMNRRRLRKPATRAPAADDWPTLCMPFAPLSARAGAPVVPAVRAVSVGTKGPPTATPRGRSSCTIERYIRPDTVGWLMPYRSASIVWLTFGCTSTICRYSPNRMVVQALPPAGRAQPGTGPRLSLSVLLSVLRLGPGRGCWGWWG